MIAVVAESYEDAALYMETATLIAAGWDPARRTTPPDTEWIVVLRPEDIRGALTGAVFLGGSDDLHGAVVAALGA